MIHELFQNISKYSKYFKIFFLIKMHGDLPSYPFFLLVSALTALLSETVVYGALTPRCRTNPRSPLSASARVGEDA